MLIRYYGHVGLPTGYGDAANETCMAILDAGLDLEISTDGKELGPAYLLLASHLRDESALSDDPDVVIVHTLPIDCAKVLTKAQIRERCPKAVCIAYTTWEGASEEGVPPVIADALALFDAVWVPSTETAIALEKGHALPHPAEVVPHAFWEGLSQELTGSVAPDVTYNFYYIGAWSRRKNVEGVIRAYLRAFGQGDRVHLHVQSAGAAPSALQIAAISCGVDPREWPSMSFSHERVSRDEIIAIHRAGDCFVTASRGEAWNLPAFEAMLAGNHVIAPQGHGSDDFLVATSAERYRSRLEPAYGDVRIVKDERTGPGQAMAQLLTCQGLTCQALWRDPDITELALLMQRACAERRRALRVFYDPAERFGRRAIGGLIKALLQGAVT